MEAQVRATNRGSNFSSFHGSIPQIKEALKEQGGLLQCHMAFCLGACNGTQFRLPCPEQNTCLLPIEYFLSSMDPRLIYNTVSLLNGGHMIQPHLLPLVPMKMIGWRDLWRERGQDRWGQFTHPSRSLPSLLPGQHTVAGAQTSTYSLGTSKLEL